MMITPPPIPMKPLVIACYQAQQNIENRVIHIVPTMLNIEFIFNKQDRNVFPLFPGLS